MTVGRLWQRATNLYRRTVFRGLFRARVKLGNLSPLISFTFDDFPRSAYTVGGAILADHGFRGTYYASLGLMGQRTAAGDVFSCGDLANVIADGHELGCHTFGHCDAWRTSPRAFERSMLENARALKRLIPNVSFRTLAYPISAPRPHTKRRVRRHFDCCRFGGQTYNAGVVDRVLLSAYFLEQNRHDPASVKKMIDRNSDACGWLIFATHDVCDDPTRFGCSPGFFEDIVRYASGSGANILPVGQAWDIVCGQVSPGIAQTCGREDRTSIDHADPPRLRGR